MFVHLLNVVCINSLLACQYITGLLVTILVGASAHNAQTPLIRFVVQALPVHNKLKRAVLLEYEQRGCIYCIVTFVGGA